MNKIIVLILGIVFCLNGCTLAPRYSRPKAPVSQSWPKGPSYPQMQAATKTLDAMELKWGSFLTDTKLQKIVQLALENNRDLKLAALNVERARALYGVQESELFPAVDAQGAMVKQRYSSDSSLTGQSYVAKQYSVDLGITAWEVDLFGRIRSLTKQALEEYLATQEARRSTQISLISEVSMAYFVMAADKEKLKLADSTLKAQKKYYDLILRQHKVKIANEIDLRRAQTQVDTARGDVIFYTQQIAKDKNALDLLAGATVPDEFLPVDLTSVKPLADIFPGLSSDVLLKRPDIVDAEHQLKGAYANIGAARAAFFPNISITTAIGSASNQFSGLFSGGKGAWAFTPQIVMPIFDMRTWASYRVSKADQKIALAKYERAIQIAFREVSDVLAVQGTINDQIKVQRSMVYSAQRVYRLSLKRYTNGIDSYLSVLDAQRSLYSAQKELIIMQLAKLINEVRAYAVLGGGA